MKTIFILALALAACPAAALEIKSAVNAQGRMVDDIALPFGAIRIRPKGSSGGHKGLNSIINSISAQGFPRMRIGILGRKNIRDLSSYVLARFNRTEQKNLPRILDAASQACGCWIKEGVDAAMNQYNNIAI